MRIIVKNRLLFIILNLIIIKKKKEKEKANKTQLTVRFTNILNISVRLARCLNSLKILVWIDPCIYINHVC